MSKQGTFEYEDRDIVCLAGERGDRRTGWINIGVHSLRVEQSPWAT